MNATPEDRLAALFAEQAPPLRDPVFTAAVMERAARRRALARVGSAVPWAIAGGLVLWSVQPVLSHSAEALAAALAPAAAVLGFTAVAVVAGLMTARRLGGWGRASGRS